MHARWRADLSRAFENGEQESEGWRGSPCVLGARWAEDVMEAAAQLAEQQRENSHDAEDSAALRYALDPGVMQQYEASVSCVTDSVQQLQVLPTATAAPQSENDETAMQLAVTQANGLHS